MAAAITVDWRGSGNGGVDWVGGTMAAAGLAALAVSGSFRGCGRCFPLLVLWAGTAVSGSSSWAASRCWAGCVVEWGGAFAGNGRGNYKAEARGMKDEKNRAFLKSSVYESDFVS